MKLNQKGVAHLQLIIVIGALVGTVGLAAYRVGQVNRNSQQYQNGQNQTDDKANELKVTEEKAEEVTVPEKQQETAPAETKPAPAPTPKTDKKSSTKSTEKPKSDKVYLTISQLDVSQNGGTLNIHSRIEKNVSGTCNFKLYKEGYSKVYASHKITNSQDCVGQLNLSGMGIYDGWSLHVWFEGDDGRTYAYQDAQPVSLINPN